MIDLSDVLIRLNNLMGRKNLPAGETDNLERYCQDAFDYAWRYYPWTFSKKRATVAPNNQGISYLPDDFDLEGWRSIDGVSEVQLGSGSSTTVSFEFDQNKGLYKAVGANKFTMTYQTEPPALTSNKKVPFPSAMAVAIGALIYAKEADNPAHADVSQEWDQFHVELDRLVGLAQRNTPRRISAYQDVMGTYTGDVGD